MKLGLPPAILVFLHQPQGFGERRRRLLGAGGFCQRHAQETMKLGAVELAADLLIRGKRLTYRQHALVRGAALDQSAAAQARAGKLPEWKALLLANLYGNIGCLLDNFLFAVQLVE